MRFHEKLLSTRSRNRYAKLVKEELDTFTSSSKQEQCRSSKEDMDKVAAARPKRVSTNRLLDSSFSTSTTTAVDLDEVDDSLLFACSSTTNFSTTAVDLDEVDDMMASSLAWSSDNNTACSALTETITASQGSSSNFEPPHTSQHSRGSRRLSSNSKSQHLAPVLGINDCGDADNKSNEYEYKNASTGTDKGDDGDCNGEASSTLPSATSTEDKETADKGERSTKTSHTPAHYHLTANIVSSSSSCAAVKNDDNNSDEPPVSAQTDYALQQWQRSHLFQNSFLLAEEDDVFLFPVLDEVDISRTLDGYEEGFGVYDQYELFYSSFSNRSDGDGDDVQYYTPSRDDNNNPVPEIQKEDDKDSCRLEDNDHQEDDGEGSILAKGNAEDNGQSLPSSSASCTEDTAHRSGLEDDGQEELSIHISPSCTSTASVCCYCREGTCGNADCSTSRFMI